MGWVQSHIAEKGSVEGLVISRGYDTKFESALNIMDKIAQLDVERLGFKLISPKSPGNFEPKGKLENGKMIELEEEDVEERQKSKEARIWLKKGNALFDQTKYDEAIPCYDKVIENDPKNKWGLINKGAALAELDNLISDDVPPTSTIPHAVGRI